ncbi:MAG: aspartate dehydrogenase [Candidatus Diapherotrites archaeon]|nr:aspartate dehydrogenase [Candidatus Diapherotrites archaeon]
MRIGIIGCGAIGSYLANRVADDKELELAFVYDTNKEHMKRWSDVALSSIEMFSTTQPDIVVECAGIEAVKQYAKDIVKEADMIVMSVAALSDNQLLKEIEEICVEHGTHIYIPSGAIVGIDGLLSARETIESVTLITRKPPSHFGRQDAEETVIFEGNAGEACRQYPRNINIAATVSLAGIGFDKTIVKIISDPHVNKNNHTLIVCGAFGRFEINVENVPTPENPKTSYLASLSAFQTIKELGKAIRVV